MLDGIWWDDDIAVHQQHAVCAARKRRADACVDAAGETEIVSGMDIRDLRPDVL